MTRFLLAASLIMSMINSAAIFDMVLTHKALPSVVTAAHAAAPAAPHIATPAARAEKVSKKVSHSKQLKNHKVAVHSQTHAKVQAKVKVAAAGPVHHAKAGCGWVPQIAFQYPPATVMTAAVHYGVHGPQLEQLRGCIGG